MNVSFILVNPAVPENVGSAARALKTMGFFDLRIVNSDVHLQEPARWLAHGAGDVLDNTTQFPSFESAIADLDFTVASTAKKRVARGEYIPVNKLAQFLIKKGETVQSVGIVFGNEACGLSNDIIRKCDMAASVPMKTQFPSLNLAQAVMIFAWELSGKGGELQAEEISAKTASYPILKSQLLKILADTGIDQNINLKNRILERAACLSGDDIKLVLSLLQKLS